MKFSKSDSRFGKIAASLMVLGLSCAFSPSPVEASTEKNFLISLEYPPGPNRQPPKSSVGAAVRGATCVEPPEDKPLTAFMSNRNNQTTTVSANPTFFIYVPPNNVQTGEFVLMDNQGKEIASKDVLVNQKSGIFQFHLPKSVNLEMGRKYRWEFSLDCKSPLREGNEKISGEIQRIDLPVKAKEELAKTIEPLEQAQVYAANNIWQETLTLVAIQRCNSPEDWKELLNSVGLGAFADESFLIDKN